MSISPQQIYLYFALQYAVRNCQLRHMGEPYDPRAKFKSPFSLLSSFSVQHGLYTSLEIRDNLNKQQHTSEQGKTNFFPITTHNPSDETLDNAYFNSEKILRKIFLGTHKYEIKHINTNYINSIARVVESEDETSVLISISTYHSIELVCLAIKALSATGYKHHQHNASPDTTPTDGNATHVVDLEKSDQAMAINIANHFIPKKRIDTKLKSKTNLARAIGLYIFDQISAKGKCNVKEISNNLKKVAASTLSPDAYDNEKYIHQESKLNTIYRNTLKCVEKCNLVAITSSDK